ncbi:hypothetical protein lbkm_1705 [Lachnospiraceae bacterium KM106-2]|nr:hypothetical protein lbkm_1705 [Lachnospiraceae bacterium KM106-2]
MRQEEMKLGKSVEIHVSREEFNFRLISKIEDVSKERVCISLISAKGRKFNFLPTDTIDFIYKDNGKMWIFKNVTAGLTKLEDDFVHYIQASQEGVTYNRRSVYRAYCAEDVRIDVAKAGHDELLWDDAKAALDDNKSYLMKNLKGMIKDISETGAGICLDEVLEEDDCISFELYTEQGCVKCKGHVIRVSREEEGAYRHLYGVRFIETTKNIQKFVFALQRIQLQNRK